MAKKQLKYKINNPNTAEETARVLLDFLIEVNTPKASKALKKASEE